jgi:hypothetical protein
MYVCCDYSIEMLRSSGILNRIKYNDLRVTTDPEEPDAQATLEEILPILIILVAGFLASFICLLAEIFVFRLRNYLIKQHINYSISFLK